MLSNVRIGVVGYCPPTKFNEIEAKEMIVNAYNQIAGLFPEASKSVVSGLTNVGVLKIAYEEAKRRRWRTVGIACKRAEEHELFPVDEKRIIGENWGDESLTFLDNIDVMVRIGIGSQSISETDETKRRGKQTFEYDLQPIL